MVNLSLKNKLLAWSCCLLVCLGLTSQALASEICLIRGQNFPIYEIVANSFWSQVGENRKACDEILKGRQTQVNKIIREKSPKLIVAMGTSAVAFTYKNFPEIPFIFSMVQSENTISAQSNLKGGIVVKIPFREQINAVKRVFPSMNRIGVIYSAENLKLFNEFKTVVLELGYQLTGHVIRGSDEALKIIPKIKDEDLLWVIPDRVVLTVKNRQKFFKETLRTGIKVYSFSPTYLSGAHGADLSVSVDWDDYGKQLGKMAQRVLKNPNQNNVESPKKTTIYLKKGRSGFKQNVPGTELVK